MKTRITRPIPLSRRKHVPNYFSSEFLSFVSARHNAGKRPQPRQSGELVESSESSPVRAIELARERSYLLGRTGVASLDMVYLPRPVDATDNGQSNSSGTSLGDGEVRERDAALLAAPGLPVDVRTGVLR